MDLRANTAVDVLIGPFVDKTDGNTTKDSLTLTAAEIKLSKNGQALTLKSDVTSAAFDDDGYYNCELDATDTDTEGNLVLIVHQAANALPVRHEFNVLSEAAWDSLYAAKDAGFMDVNIKTVGRADTQETEADNLESACANYSATRGLTGTAVPAVAADGAFGLPISDAGGLDLDVKLANTNEVTAVRMATLTDWINGGRLDAILDARMAEASINTTGGAVDTVTTLTTKTGFALSATGADLILKTAVFALAIADVVADEVLTGATHNIPNSLGRRIRQIDAAFEVHSGTAQAGSTATTIILDTGASTVNGIYNGDRIIIVGGTGQEEHGLVISYVGSTRVATMAEAWVITPDDTSEFEIVPASVDVKTVKHAVQTAGDLAALIVTVDGVVDAIKAITDALPDSGALTAIGTDTARLTAVRAAVLTDWINGGRLDLLLDAIPTTMVGTDNAATAADLLDKLGAVDETAADGDPSATESVMQYVKQIVNTLEGAAGIVTMKAGAAPANAVSIGEMVRAIYDALKTDTITLPGQGAPPLTPTRDEIAAWLYKMMRNRKRQTTTIFELYADDETTVDAKATVSDGSSIAIKQELVSGP